MTPLRMSSHTPPQSVDSEQALLGAILHHNEALDFARDHVQASDFVEPVHGHIFEVMCKRRDAGELIDLGLMKAVLGNIDLGTTTIGQYITGLMHGATTISGAPGYARLIAMAARMRDVLATAQDAVTTLTAAAGAVFDPAPHAEAMIESLDAVASAGLAEHARRITLSNSIANVIARVERTRRGLVPRGTPYGVPRLDAVTLGLRPSQLVVLAGRPGMGKTMAAMHIGLTAARRTGPVGFFSLEMDAGELSERALAALVYDPNAPEPITYRAIAEARSLSEEALVRLAKAEQDSRTIPLWIEPQAGISLAQIATRSRQMKLRAERSGKPLAAIIVDHIGLIRPSKRYLGNRVQELTEITSGLKGLAKELGVPVLGLSQLNREVEKRVDKRPKLSDLRESGSIEQDADVVLCLFREAYYLEHQPDRSEIETERLTQLQNVLEIEILKQRSGPTGCIQCFCDIACNVLAEAVR